MLDKCVCNLHMVIAYALVADSCKRGRACVPLSL